MRFSTVFTVLACGATALAAGVAPAALVTRANTDIIGVLTNLDKACAPSITNLKACSDSDCTDKVCGEIVGAIEVAVKNVTGVTGAAGDDLATAINRVFSNIVGGLDEHKTTCADACGKYTVYPKIDSGLSDLLKVLDVDAAGILVKVAGLLGAVIAGLLQRIGFTSCIATLKLKL